ncbi:MAG: ABC transporter permease [Thermoplasmata archaeon]
MKRMIREAAWIAHKDLLEFSRNRFAVVMLIVVPMFMMLMTGFIFPSENTLKDTPVAIVDCDANSEDRNYTVMFLDTLYATNNKTNLFVFSNLESKNDAKKSITRGEISGAIIVPEGFSNAISNDIQTNITILTDQSNPQVSLMLTSMVSNILDNIGERISALKVARMLAQNGSSNQSTTNTTIVKAYAIVKPYTIKTKSTVEGNTNYYQFMAPGLITMVVMMSVMMGLPRAISHEKEIGTLDGMMVAPIRRVSIILGKTLAQSARGLIQGTIILILAVFIFGITIHGSLALAYLLMLLGVFSFIGLGIVLTSFASDEETAMMVMTAIQFPMMFLSGVFYPIQQMPWFMQIIAKFLPLTYAVDAMRKVIVLGAGLEDIFLDVMVLLIFGLVMLAIAVPAFRYAMAR